MNDELYGIRISDEYLAHHGILGQKWGKKNGPPYPLDYRKLSAEEKQLAKADAIRRGDIQEVQFNRNEFSDEEVRAAITRFQLNAQLSSLNIKPSKMDKIDDFINTTSKVANFAERSVKVWNSFAKISNAMGLTEKPLLVIDNRNPWEKNKDKDNNNNNNNNNNVPNIPKRVAPPTVKERVQEVKNAAKVEKEAIKQQNKLDIYKEKLEEKRKK